MDGRMTCGGSGGWGGASSRRRRDSSRWDCESSLSVASSAVVFHASMPDNLSKAWVIRSSKLSNFLLRSSMAVVTWASNLVGFRGARSEVSSTGEAEQGAPVSQAKT